MAGLRPREGSCSNEPLQFAVRGKKGLISGLRIVGLTKGSV